MASKPKTTPPAIGFRPIGHVRSRGVGKINSDLDTVNIFTELNTSRAYEMTRKRGNLSYIDDLLEQAQLNNNLMPMMSQDAIIGAEMVTFINGNSSEHFPKAWATWLNGRFPSNGVRTLEAGKTIRKMLDDQIWDTWRPPFSYPRRTLENKIQLALEDLLIRL